MKKDLFNNKIEKYHIKNIWFTIISFSLILLAFSITIFCMALFYEKIEYSARIMMYIISAIFLLIAILYPSLSIYTIRTYPKHVRLAHFLFNNDRIFVNPSNEIKHLYNTTIKKIINYVPSKELKKQLLKNKEQFTILQYATLIEKYCTDDKSAILEMLISLTENQYERTLLKYAVKDYRQHNKLTQKTIDYYNNNDPRSVKPHSPFCENIFFS